MKVRDLMSSPLCIVKPEDSVKDIINAMTAEYEGIAIIAKKTASEQNVRDPPQKAKFSCEFLWWMDPENVKIDKAQYS